MHIDENPTFIHFGEFGPPNPSGNQIKSGNSNKNKYLAPPPPNSNSWQRHYSLSAAAFVLISLWTFPESLESVFDYLTNFSGFLSYAQTVSRVTVYTGNRVFWPRYLIVENRSFYIRHTNINHRHGNTVFHPAILCYYIYYDRIRLRPLRISVLFVKRSPKTLAKDRYNSRTNRRHKSLPA